MSNLASAKRLPEEARKPLGLSWRAADLTGVRFGKLVAIEPVGRNAQRSVLWRCTCDCGGEHTASAATLQGGNTNSCGCERSAAALKRIEARGGPWNRGALYQIRADNEEFRSLAAWKKAVIRRFGNACEICGWQEAACDAHHLKPRAKGGRNTILNSIVLCPNHHRGAHQRKDLMGRLAELGKRGADILARLEGEA